MNKFITLLFTALVSSFVNAGFDADVQSANPVTVSVRSHVTNKSEYARSDALSSNIVIKFRGRCNSGYLHEFGLQLGSYTHNFPGLTGKNQSISGSNGSSWKTHIVSGQQVLGANSSQLIQACNDLVDQKVSQGYGLESILDQDSSIPKAIGLPVKYRYWCKKKVGFASPPSGWTTTTLLDVTALCKATGYQEPVEINQVKLVIDKQSTLSGSCKIFPKGSLVSSKPNQVIRFQYEHIDEDFRKKLSPIYQVRTDQQGYANFSHEYPVPNGPGRDRGKLRVLGVSHDFKSKQKGYSLDCQEGGPTGIQQPTPSTLDLKVTPVQNSHQVFGNQSCPTKLKVVGTLKAGSDISGQAVFVGETILNTHVQSFSVSKGQNKKFVRKLDVEWVAPIGTTLGTGGGIAPQLMKKNILQGMNIVGDNSQNIILSYPRKSFPISCSAFSVQPGLQIQNGGYTAPPDHTGGGAPTDLRGNQNSVNKKLPVKKLDTTNHK